MDSAFTLSRHKGFTLLELMVVLVIVAIITGIAATSYFGFERERRLTNAAFRVADLMRSARNQAILLPAVLGVRFSQNHYVFKRYYLDYHTGTGRFVSMTQSQLMQPIFLPENVTLTLLSVAHKKPMTHGEAPQIIFSQNGMVTPFLLRISANNTSHSYVLKGEVSGQIVLKKESRAH